MYKVASLIILFITTIDCVWAQTTESSTLDEQMNNTLRSNDKMTVVIAVLCVIFIAITAYLISQDRRLKRIEKEILNPIRNKSNNSN